MKVNEENVRDMKYGVINFIINDERSDFGDGDIPGCVRSGVLIG